MEQILKIKSDKLKVLVSPEVGGSIYSFEYYHGDDWLNIMRPTPRTALESKEAGDFSSYNLIPFSNRIENGILRYKGREYRLAINNDDGHTIHGEVWQRPLKVTYNDNSRIVLTFDSRDFDDMSWPFPFYSEITYELIDEDSLAIHLLIKNIGETTMPAGMGIHPYFMRRLTESDNKVELRMPIKGIYPGDTTIPTGTYVDVEERLDFSKGRELTDDFLDNCFAIGDDDIIITWPGSGVQLTMKKDAIFSHGIIYCPMDNKDFFAIEPVTNCNNGFNMDEKGIKNTGTVHLAPGEILEGTIELRLGDIK
ncbi:MAG TPA: aldose 1-epimerase [Clostridiales bacterium]|nr:aldose 1-epimerase [Clostridiales bacterium]